MSAAALEVNWRKLDTSMLTASIIHCTGKDSYAGAAVNVQTKPRVALAVERASGVHTPMLAAPVVNLALINICPQVS